MGNVVKMQPTPWTSFTWCRQFTQIAVVFEVIRGSSTEPPPSILYFFTGFNLYVGGSCLTIFFGYKMLQICFHTAVHTGLRNLLYKGICANCTVKTSRGPIARVFARESK